MKHFGFVGTALGAAVVVGLVGCAAGVDAEKPQPTVLDAPLDSPGKSKAPETPGAGGVDSDDASPDDPEPTPIPASSDGPAQNWPPPDTPEEIYQPTEEGAEALLQYFYEARHYARVTGDTGPLEAVSTSDCDLCGAEVDVVQELFENEGWYVSEPDEVGHSYLRLESEDLATGLYALHEEDFETYLAGELLGETIADTVDAFGFAMLYEDDLWRMIEINYIGEYERDLHYGRDEPGIGEGE
ncbi:DUF6318 family protein [Nesterenkonia haasae]|uniref:DUF6318 family protein n=1 Tax=Nesterenkonia haasae TaxID=2587813 RepID=UPI001391BD90|nr:DUF6318 family protein [Nesterenkonia haasae]NDK31473.1 hypothetical protein [Nesterenkonia haasae]